MSLTAALHLEKLRWHQETNARLSALMDDQIRSFTQELQAVAGTIAEVAEEVRCEIVELAADEDGEEAAQR